VIADRIPDFVTAATDVMVAFLESLADNLDRVISAGADIVIAVIEGIGDNLLRITEAAFETIITFVNGVADAIDENAPAMRSAGANLAGSIISGMLGGLTDRAGEVVEGARKMAGDALGAMGSVFRRGSPSRATMEMGNELGQGLSIGMEQSIPMVNKAAEHVGDDTLETMKRSIAKMSDLIPEDMDMNPTITPVLDLSEIRKEAGKIGETLGKQEIDIDRVFMKAKDVSAKQMEIQEAKRVRTEPTEQPAPVEFNYTQNNTSPKALTSAEIYRQTKNQLAAAKGALTPDVARQG
jgi:phage-related protein